MTGMLMNLNPETGPTIVKVIRRVVEELGDEASPSDVLYELEDSENAAEQAALKDLEAEFGNWDDKYNAVGDLWPDDLK